jgi:hypothetical protein
VGEGNKEVDRKWHFLWQCEGNISMLQKMDFLVDFYHGFGGEKRQNL